MLKQDYERNNYFNDRGVSLKKHATESEDWSFPKPYNKIICHSTLVDIKCSQITGVIL